MYQVNYSRDQTKAKDSQELILLWKQPLQNGEGEWGVGEGVYLGKFLCLLPGLISSLRGWGVHAEKELTNDEE